MKKTLLLVTLAMVLPSAARADIITFQHPEVMWASTGPPDVRRYEELGVALSGAMYFPRDPVRCNSFTERCVYWDPPPYFGQIRVYGDDGGILTISTTDFDPFLFGYGRPIERLQLRIDGQLDITMQAGGFDFPMAPTANATVDFWLRDFLPNPVSQVQFFLPYNNSTAINVYAVEVPEPGLALMVGLAVAAAARKRRPVKQGIFGTFHQPRVVGESVGSSARLRDGTFPAVLGGYDSGPKGVTGGRSHDGPSP